MFFSLIFSLFVFEFVLSFFVQQYQEHKWDNKILNTNYSRSLNTLSELRFLNIKTNEKKYFVNDEKIESEFFDEKKYTKYYDAHYSIYKNTSFRYTKCNENAKETYVFLGCSFTFGDGLNDDETLPYFFSKLYNFKYNVVNYGVSGKSSNSALNILNTGLLKDKIYKHFCYSLIELQIDRNFTCGTGMCSDVYLYKDSKIYRIKYPYYDIVNIFKRSFIFVKVFLPIINEHNRYYYESYMIKSLEKMNKIIEEQYNSKLTIIVWPNFDNNFINRLKQTNLDLIFLPEYFNSEEQYTIKYDGHPNAKANEEIAEILYNHINGLEQRTL